MPKALCMSGLVVAGLVIILFAADLAAGIPFRRASAMMDIALLASAALLGLLSPLGIRDLVRTGPVAIPRIGAAREAPGAAASLVVPEAESAV